MTIPQAAPAPGRGAHSPVQGGLGRRGGRVDATGREMRSNRRWQGLAELAAIAVLTAAVIALTAFSG